MALISGILTHVAITLTRRRGGCALMSVVCFVVGFYLLATAQPLRFIQIEGQVERATIQDSGAYTLWLRGDTRAFELQPGLFHPALRQPPQMGTLVTLWTGEGGTEVYALADHDQQGKPLVYTTSLYQNPASAQVEAWIVGGAISALGVVFAAIAMFFPQLAQRLPRPRRTHLPRLRYAPTYPIEQPYDV